MKKVIAMLSFTLSANVFSVTYEQATKQLDKKNYATAYQNFKSLSQLGNKDAQFNLGVMHLKGEGREVSYPNAYAWFKLAASEEDKGYNTTFENITKKISKKDLKKGEAIFTDIA